MVRTWVHDVAGPLLPAVVPLPLRAVMTEHLALEGAAPSIGSVGDAYDNALMETINGLYKAEGIRTTVPRRAPPALRRTPRTMGFRGPSRIPRP